MAAWCMAHPWMTFFIALSVARTPFVIVRNVVHGVNKDKRK